MDNVAVAVVAVISNWWWRARKAKEVWGIHSCGRDWLKSLRSYIIELTAEAV
jgi:hypothetical protein